MLIEKSKQFWRLDEHVGPEFYSGALIHCKMQWRFVASDAGLNEPFQAQSCVNKKRDSIKRKGYELNKGWT